jgi:hypothetical protein
MTKEQIMKKISDDGPHTQPHFSYSAVGCYFELVAGYPWDLILETTRTKHLVINNIHKFADNGLLTKGLV